MWNIKFWLALLGLMALLLPALGQDFLSDTVHLEGVVVTGLEEEKYTMSTLTHEMPTDSLGAESLTDLLLRELPIAVNQYGARGQLSSINLRGLGPSRTALLWNNMPINSFSNGQSDLNLVSSVGAAQISLQEGPGSSVYGSGAIGGTITLLSAPTFNQPLTVSTGHTIGSFGYNQTEAGIQWGNDLIAYSLRVQNLQADNDFEYDDRGETINQRNAAFDSRNVAQDLAWKVNDNSSMSASLWFAENDRRIQPSRNDFTSDDQLFDRNFRSHIGYYLDPSDWHAEFNIGYTRDRQVYNEGTPLVVERVFGLSQMELEQWDKFTVLGGVNANLLFVNGASFEDNISEIRNDWFTSLDWVPLSWISVGANLRQPMVDGELKAFSPSLLTSLDLLQSEVLRLNAEAQWSRSYRLPTLNDRFWNPGGNPSLDAELATTVDVAVAGTLNFSALQLEATASAYRSEVDNWILWRPGGRERDDQGQVTSFWFPQNLEQVVASGLNFEVAASYELGNWGNVAIRHNATYSETINQIGLGSADRSQGKQVAFTPRRTSLTRLDITLFEWHFGISRTFTGERFTEANNELAPLPEFTLYDIFFSKNLLKTNNFQLQASGRVRNLTDEDYESYENRAMPGINYDITLKLNYYLQ